mmetsp:Transcript_49726/g.95038  ORF Transcript_49726/g.95038 Transcript_49726/m.95038 type:complete len:549 (+) Transcript_49726:102-1748(+)
MKKHEEYGYLASEEDHVSAPLVGNREYGNTDLQTSLYNDGPRVTRDLPFGVAYVLMLLFTLVGGVYGYANMSSSFFSIYDTEFTSDPNNCPAGGVDPRRLMETNHEDDDAFAATFSSVHFLRRGAVMMAVSAVGSFAVGFGLLALLVSHAGAVVKSAFLTNVAVNLACAAAASLASAYAAFFYLALAALWAVLYWMWQCRLELVARLFTVSATGFKANPHLVTLCVGLKLAAAVMLTTIVACLFTSVTNGKVVPMDEVNYSPELKSCVDADLQTTPCCGWKADGWVSGYLAFAAVTFMWTAMTVFEMRTFAISGAIAKWYFAPAGTVPAGSLSTALGHAAGKQFGTVCFASLVLTIVQTLRSMARKDRDHRGNIAMWLLQCVLECVFSLIEYLTNFATIFAAITGLGFCEAGKEVTSILKRNFLSSYAVWWMPAFVLNSIALTAALGWGMVTGVIFYLEVSHKETAAHQAFAVGAACFLVVLLVLLFFSAIMLDVLRVVYICYAMDKDRSSITRPEVHEVYVLLPVQGAAVQNPSGDYAYANPGSQHA